MTHHARAQTRPTREKTCRAPRSYPCRARRPARRGTVPGATSPAASWYSRRRLDSRRSRRRVPSSLVSERPPPPPPPPRTPGAPGTLPSPLDPHPPLLSFDVARELLDARDAGASAVDATSIRHHHTFPLSRADGVLLDPSPDDASPWSPGTISPLSPTTRRAPTSSPPAPPPSVSKPSPRPPPAR